METRQKHIDSFVDMMKQKGYIGHFMNEVGLEDALSSHLTIFLKNKGDIGMRDKFTIPLSVLTEQGPNKEYTACHFIIRYHRKTGFHVSELSINRRLSPKEPIKEMLFSRPAYIPAKEVVNELVKLTGKKVKKHVKRTFAEGTLKKRLVKKAMLTLILLSALAGTQAQTFDEWFKQKKTQLKYLVDQIAALQAYGIVLQKGYSIVKDGLHTIGDLKNGEFHLHGKYFTSLKSVSPAIAKYPRIAGIISLQLSISSTCTNTLTAIKQEDLFTSREINYVANVNSTLLQACGENIEALTSLVTSGTLEMTDDERYQRIEALYDDMQDKYMFAQHFSNEVRWMGTDRKIEHTGINKIRQYFDIVK